MQPPPQLAPQAALPLAYAQPVPPSVLQRNQPYPLLSPAESSIYILQKKAMDNEMDLRRAERLQLSRLQLQSEEIQLRLQSAQDQAYHARIWGCVHVHVSMIESMSFILCLSMILSATNPTDHARDRRTTREEIPV